MFWGCFVKSFISFFWLSDNYTFLALFFIFWMLPDPEAAGSADVFTLQKISGNMIGVSFLTLWG